MKRKMIVLACICLFFVIDLLAVDGKGRDESDHRIKNVSFEQEKVEFGKYRKLPKELECPLDYWMVSLSVPYFSPLNKLGVTANTLTGISFLLQLSACYLMYKHRTFWGGAFWIFGYFFDAIDGSFARYHQASSSFGDLFDHLSDWTCLVILLLVLMKSYRIRLYDYIFMFALVALASGFIAIQELYVIESQDVSNSQVLGMLPILIAKMDLDPKSSLQVVRWFGTANIHLMNALYIASFPYTRCLETIFLRSKIALSASHKL